MLITPIWRTRTAHRAQSKAETRSDQQNGCFTLEVIASGRHYGISSSRRSLDARLPTQLRARSLRCNEFPQAFPRSRAPKVPLKVGSLKDVLTRAASLRLSERDARNGVKLWVSWPTLLNLSRRRRCPRRSHGRNRRRCRPLIRSNDLPRTGHSSQSGQAHALRHRARSLGAGQRSALESTILRRSKPAAILFSSIPM